MKVTLHVETPQGDPEETAELTIWLKDQIKQLSIESIEIPKAGPLPDGARVGDPFTWGAIIVAVAPTVVGQLLKEDGFALHSVLNLKQSAELGVERV